MRKIFKKLFSKPAEAEKPEQDDGAKLREITSEQASAMDDDELEALAASAAQKQKESSGKKKKWIRKRRKFSSGPLKYIVTGLTVAMSVYHLYGAIFTINPLQKRVIHVLFVMVLVFLLYPATKHSPQNRPSIVDAALIAVTVIILVRLLIRLPAISAAGGRGTMTDYISGAILLLLVMELGRRTLGWILPVLACLFIAYGFFGKLVPGVLHHSGFSWIRIVRHLTLTTEGVFGSLANVSSSFIFLFILFGAFLGVTGVSSVFNDLAMALAGSRRGGPAKVSVLASGLMGSVSGSASANVVTTGAFTIPLMRKTGYKPEFASSVEAAASTGGQIMPPVMGSAAYLIADNLGIPLVMVLKAALLPAIMYFYSIWHMVDLRARKEKIYGLRKADLPSLKKLVFTRGHLFIPLIGIIWMLIAGVSATRSAVYGIALSVAVSFFRKDTRIKPKQLLQALEGGALSALSVAVACVVIGIVVGIISLTGAVLAASAAIMKVSGGSLIVTLLLTMVIALILGMGMPTTAVYIITSTVAASALVSMGVSDIGAHLFVFYYGILSAITPPVCTAAYTAAGLSGSDPNKVGFSAVKLAIAGWIIPFMFVYSEELLLPAGTGAFTLIRVIITSLIGVLALGWGVEGWCRRKMLVIERIASLAGSILLIDSGLYTDIAGIAIIGVIFAIHKVYERKHPEEKGYARVDEKPDEINTER